MKHSDKLKKAVRLLAGGVSVLACIFAALFLIKYFPVLRDIFLSSDPTREMERFIAGLGGRGPAALVLLQSVHIAFAFLPGEPIELAAGILFGGFTGSVLCLSGALIGSAAVYFAVKKLGHSLIDAFHDRQAMGKFRRIKAFHQEKSAETLTFFLFLIPAVPKDFLTFLAPLTPMKPLRFLLISTLGRAPGMFITTYAGQSILAGDYLTAAILYGILTLGAAGGWFFYRHLTSKT